MLVYLSDELVRALARDREEEARETRPHSHPHKPMEDSGRQEPGGGEARGLWLRLGVVHGK